MISYEMKMLAENLRQLKGDKSVSKLARDIGIPQQALASYINCTRAARLANLCKIADYFNISIDKLLGRK